MYQDTLKPPLRIVGAAIGFVGSSRRAIGARRLEASQPALERHIFTMMVIYRAPSAMNDAIAAHLEQFIVEALVLGMISRSGCRNKSDENHASRKQLRLAHPTRHEVPPIISAQFFYMLRHS
jgi:hypothetical protein